MPKRITAPQLIAYQCIPDSWRLMVYVLGLGQHNIKQAVSDPNDLRKLFVLIPQAQGRHFGRSKRLTQSQAQELCTLKASGVAVSQLVQRYGLTRASVYRYLTQGQPVQAEAAD